MGASNRKEKKTESNEGAMILALILKQTLFAARTRNLHSIYSQKTKMMPRELTAVN